MRYPAVLLQQIKDRIDPEDVLLRLGYDVTPRGSELRCPCPIHHGEDKNFSWNLDTHTWTCFSRGCGEDLNLPRDVFLLAMLVYNVSFSSAVSMVASWVGYSLGDFTYDKEKEDELKITRWLKRRRTMMERGDVKRIDESLLSMFDFSPHPYMLKRKFPEWLLEEFEVGFAKSGELKGRIIVPIRHHDGELIGFSGRLPIDDKSLFSAENPKYKHYADFRSGDTLYGFHKAKPYVQAYGSLILVEGFFDVLRAWQHGVRNISATMGTSITDQQIQLVVNYTSTVYLAYDGDDAGRIATERIYNRIKHLCDVKIIILEEGLDFGDLTDTQMWSLLSRPRSYLEFTEERRKVEIKSSNKEMATA